jgi:hypothetical protein
MMQIDLATFGRSVARTFTSLSQVAPSLLKQSPSRSSSLIVVNIDRGARCSLIGRNDRLCFTQQPDPIHIQRGTEARVAAYQTSGLSFETLPIDLTIATKESEAGVTQPS